MGSSISSLFTRLFGKKQIRVLMVGLDAVGKTTILYRLKLGVVETQPHPTIGFNVETIQHKNISFTVWDLGGGDKIRALWKHYFRDTEGELKGVIFVIDSKDRNRVDEAAYEIHRMMKEAEFQGAVLLVLANKQDLADAMTVTELTELLRLKELQNCKWHVQGTVGLQGLGLYEGLDWMSNELVSPQ